MSIILIIQSVLTVFRPDYTRPDLQNLGGTFNKSEVLVLKTWLISDNNDVTHDPINNWKDWAKIQQCKEVYYNWDKYQHYTILQPNFAVTEDPNVLYFSANYDDPNRQQAWEHYMCDCIDASIWCRKD